MSLTVQQLLADAKRLSGRLREHDQSADLLITRAQEVLKEVDAMKQYQEDVENLNEVAHNRPRAQLVLGIQQENRHIRALQQENKELRAALEEHQNALELIMSKYRQHVTRLINSTRIDKNLINNHKTKLLQARTDKVCEMAAVMKESVKLDEAASNQQQELLSRLITENKGLRELLDISRKNGSATRGRALPKPSQDKEVQTEEEVDAVTVVTLPCPAPSRPAPPTPTAVPPLVSHMECSPEPPDTDGSCREHSSASESDETSDDDSIKFDTIKLASRRKTVVPTTLKEEEEEEVVKDRLEVGLKDRLDPIDKDEKEVMKEELVKDRLEGDVEAVKDEPLVNHSDGGASKVKEDSTVNHTEDRLENVIKTDEMIPAEEHSIPHKNESAHLDNSIDSIEKTLESFEKTIDCLENSSEDDLVDSSRVESCNTATATIETNASVDKVTKVEVENPKEVTLNEDLIGCEQNHKPVSIQNDNKENILV